MSADLTATAGRLAKGFAERAEHHDRDGSFPKSDFDDLRGAGLLGLMVPTRLGGNGAGFADYARVAMELARGNAATALVYNMHASVTGALATTPDELARALGAPESFFAARDRVLADAAAGALYAVAMSERGAGSRLSEVATTYEPEGAGWRIRGRKTFCSGAGHADAYLVVARSVTGDPPAVSQFLVPAGPGITVEPTWDALGMRATASHDLHLDVLAPQDALLGGVEGLAVLLAQVMPQWLVASYAAVYAGLAQAAVDAAVEHLHSRTVAGRPGGLAALPAVRARIGRADAAVAATRLTVLEAAAAVDAAPGDPATNRAIYRAKLLAGDTAMEVAASMLEACGTSATRRGHPLERIYRDARCGALQPATSDVCTLVGYVGARPEPGGGHGGVTVVGASIVGGGFAVPPAMQQQGLWDDFFRDHYAGSRLAERVWHSSGITTRHGVVDPRVEDVSSWGTGARMQRFVTEAMPLGKEAVALALDSAGVDPADVGLFAVVSCTGYATPGLDILLSRDLGMPPSVQRLFVGHMGCYAAIPGLASVADTVNARGLTAVLLCLELASLHVQPATADPQQMVAHALFSDAAAAVVLRPSQPGLEVVDIAARTDWARSDQMTWDVTDLGFRMGLSPEVPDVLAMHVRDLVEELLGRHGMVIEDVAGWAVHPGGPRILDVCRDELGLEETALTASRSVLRDYGNCSSATVLLVLDRLMREQPAPKGPVVALAFGPGLTLYAALLRRG